MSDIKQRLQLIANHLSLPITHNNTDYWYGPEVVLTLGSKVDNLIHVVCTTYVQCRSGYMYCNLSGMHEFQTIVIYGVFVMYW